MKQITRKFFAVVSAIVLSAMVAVAAPPENTHTMENGPLAVRISVVDGQINYSVLWDDKEVMADMTPKMTFSNGVTAGSGIKSFKFRSSNIDNTYTIPVGVKTTKIEDKAAQCIVETPTYDVVFRLYPDAVAYRFVTKFKDKEVKVMSENATYNFTSDDKILFPEEKSMYTHQERKFIDTKLSEIADGRFCSPPMLVSEGDLRMLITEVDLTSYPGIYYEKSGKENFKAVFPHFAVETAKRSDRNVVVVKAADYLAVTAGQRSYPWRVALLTDSDTKLLESTTLTALVAPTQIAPTAECAWIRPGKATWDWWHDNNLTGVPFKTGMNTATYKYFIDFAAANKIEYVILDEGWYDIKKNITSVVPGLDMDELARYAKSKNIDLILWMTWLALEDNEDAAFEMFKKWDIKGLKIDFMQRDDQWMVDWYHRIAKRAFDNKLLIDYHGAYTPRGLNITYPNMMTSEGVYGGEQNKWTDDLTPKHNVTLPFTRMALGPIDYTPGAMTNSNQAEYKASWNSPMSLGTRCHQLGMYVVYESPLQMLCDSPTAYEKEPECMEFLSAVPAVWDETRALKASVGEYVVVARRSGDKWYIGGMTDWTARTIDMSLSFLGEGDWKIKMWIDVTNTDRNAKDFQVIEHKYFTSESGLAIGMASGGGFVAIIEKMPLSTICK